MTANTNTPKTEYPEPLSNFQEGQWWTGELDRLAKSPGATDDQKRAVAVVHHLLRSVALAAPQPEATSTEAPYPPMPAGWFHTNAEMLAFADATVAQRAAQAPTAVQASGLSDEDLYAIEFAVGALKCIAERREQVGDIIEPIDSIKKAQAKAAHALKRLEPVFHRLDHAALATAAVQGDASSVPSAAEVEIEKMIGLCEEKEWAETYPVTPLGQRPDTVLCDMHNELHEAQDDAPAAPGPAASSAVPLTAKAIGDVLESVYHEFSYLTFARAIEAAHGIGAAASPALAPEQSHG